MLFRLKIKGIGPHTEVNRNAGTLECHTVVEQSLETLSNGDSKNSQVSSQQKRRRCAKQSKTSSKEPMTPNLRNTVVLIIQGRWTKLLEAKRTDLRWIGDPWATPHEVSSRRGNRDDKLATNTGRPQPGPLGKGHQSLRHVLNACPVALMDRDTWRHNSVLKELVITPAGLVLDARGRGNDKIKRLISLRQKTFHRQSANVWKFYRNLTQRALARAKKFYYTDRVASLKTANPKQWHQEIMNMANVRKPDSNISVPGIATEDNSSIANAINTKFAQVSQALPALDLTELLAFLPAPHQLPSLAVWDVYINASKQSRPTRRRDLTTFN
ncbi:hypothetical protein Bbelb_037710 [Branchiostoma belcheri]|nr:hypothetical protein Bbelb_037710 [Branchiostoma belcheri]